MPRGITIPPVTRACLLSCVGFSVVNAALRYSAYVNSVTDTTAEAATSAKAYAIPWLTIIPAESVLFPWTFAIATFVEQNIFTLLITLPTLFYGGKYLERAWGSKELAKFILVISVVPNFLAFLIYVAWFAISGNSERSYVIHLQCIPGACR